MNKRSKEYREYSKHLSKLVSKANHRYDRLKKAGWNTPALETANKTGGRFKNGRNLSYKEMQRERKRVENFLNSKTSTKIGTRKTINKMLKTTGLDKHLKTKDVMNNKKTLDKYFKVYKKVREYDRVKGIGRSYRSTMDAVTSVFENVGVNGSVDDILDDVIRSLESEVKTIIKSEYDLKWIL